MLIRKLGIFLLLQVLMTAAAFTYGFAFGRDQGVQEIREAGVEPQLRFPVTQQKVAADQLTR